MWLFLYMFKNVNAKKGIHDRHEKQGRSYMLKGGGPCPPPPILKILKYIYNNFNVFKI